MPLSPTGQRYVVWLGALAVAAVAAYWHFFSDGLPIVWGPSASAAEIAEGQSLFEREWEPNDPLAHGDGLGPVFNARSCAACHFQGGLGGGGGLEHNALSYEVFARPGDPTFVAGAIHNFSTSPAFKESEQKLRGLYPIIKGRTVSGLDFHCAGSTTIPDFDPVSTQLVQPTALFGAGWIDLVSDRAILRNARNRGIRTAARELSLEFDNVPVGRVRQVKGGVGKFGWKGQFATLQEFVAAACANELGLGTPSVEQATPLGTTSQTVPPDLDKKQFRALVSFVKTLPRPVESETPSRGKELFTSVGCAICHVPDMGGVKGVYSDFLLYTLDDPLPPGGGGGGYGLDPPPQLQLPTRRDDEPRQNEWKTPALWGVADSAPYMHDGSAPTLKAAIQRHKGDAKPVTEKYNALSPGDQAEILAFLGTLKAPPSAVSLVNPSVTLLSKK